jgi:TRAP-type C4-dicarboxylate transport system permease small subunit
VAIRYLTYQPLAWTEEAARICFVWLCLMGAAVASRRGAHFAVDFLPRQLPMAPRRLVLAGLKLIEAGFYAVVTWAGYSTAVIVHQQTSPTMDIPMSLAYGAIPVACLLMGLFCLRDAVRALRAPES